MATDCLTMLGLRPGASRTEILAAFRAKSKDCHPDQGGNPEEFRRLLAAKNAALSALEYAEFFRETHIARDEGPIGKISSTAQPPQNTEFKARKDNKSFSRPNWSPVMLSVGVLAALVWAIVQFTNSFESGRPQTKAPSPQNSVQSWQRNSVIKALASFR